MKRCVTSHVWPPAWRMENCQTALNMRKLKALQASATCCTNRCCTAGPVEKPTSIHLDMVALFLFHLLRKLLPINSVLLCNGAKALLHARLHALEAAHVNVSLWGLHELPELVPVLRHLGLDVHLLPCCVLVLPRDGVVIEQRLGVGHAHEKPSEALELPPM